MNWPPDRRLIFKTNHQSRADSSARLFAFPRTPRGGKYRKIPLTTEAIAAPPNSIFYTSLLRSR